MKSKSLIVIFTSIIGMFLFIGCNELNNSSGKRIGNSLPDSLKNIKAKVEAINQLMEEAIMKEDFESQLGYMTDDVIIDSPFEPPVCGKDTLSRIFKKNKASGYKVRSFSGRMEKLWTCGDRVYERGTWGLSYTTSSHKNPMAAYGSYFQIWSVLPDSALKIEYVIYTLDHNPFQND
jgi:ketosteroid isomerase-like protein